MNVDQAIQALQASIPGSLVGATATPGHANYNRAARLRFRKCECGRRVLGWPSEEYIAQDGNAVISIGYDSRSNKISCGPKGYHSPAYGNTPVC
jgi:hypothetical protein